jgi:hypothetical protein
MLAAMNHTRRLGTAGADGDRAGGMSADEGATGMRVTRGAPRRRPSSRRLPRLPTFTVSAVCPADAGIGKGVPFIGIVVAFSRSRSSVSYGTGP